MPSLRLIIADDAAEFRKGVRTMLAFERDLEVIGIARDGQEAVELAKQHQPDIAVMDINMPRMDGLSAVRALAQVSPRTVCMIMSSEDQRDLLREAMAAGVREYLVKPFTADEFVAAVQRTAQHVYAARQRADAVQSAQADRDKMHSQLILSYLKGGRTDDEALAAYAQFAADPPPTADYRLLVKLAETLVAVRDWRSLALLSQLLEQYANKP